MVGAFTFAKLRALVVVAGMCVRPEGSADSAALEEAFEFLGGDPHFAGGNNCSDLLAVD